MMQCLICYQFMLLISSTISLWKHHDTVAASVASTSADTDRVERVILLIVFRRKVLIFSGSHANLLLLPTPTMDP